MGSNHAKYAILFFLLVGSWITLFQCSAIETESHRDHDDDRDTTVLYVDATDLGRKKIADNMFGVFFEEINHAGAGGLWAELVQNRGFEAKDDQNNPTMDPWTVIGDESSVKVSTDYSSKFEQNKNALRLDVLCTRKGYDKCPKHGVGIYNPGYWGMNIVKDKKYKVTFHVRSLGSVHLDVSLTGSTGFDTLAHKHISFKRAYAWTKVHFVLKARKTNHHARFQILTSNKGTVWLDQLSVMPVDTHNGHGFRKDLYEMVHNLQPKFVRFPGGTYVQGNYLPNMLNWKDTIGAWEERPPHFNDIWNYWTDNAMGQYDYLQLAEDLGALPIWVFNIGLPSRGDYITPDKVGFLVQDALDGIEFAIGEANSTKYGAIRAEMGHPEPFDLRYVSPGNENCWPGTEQRYYVQYKIFYDAIRKAFPQIKIISNCDGSVNPLPSNHPADLYDFHTYETADYMYRVRSHQFDKTPRNGIKAFVSEYAVWQNDGGRGTLLGALAESAFLMGLERNSDIVEFASYAPLFVNWNDKKWLPDAIPFDSYRTYGTPSYWMQTFFIESSGATYLNSELKHQTGSDVISASAILWKDRDSQEFLRVKVVNFGDEIINFRVVIEGYDAESVHLPRSKIKVMGSDNVWDENSFENATNIVPVEYYAVNVGRHLEVKLYPHTLTAIDMARSEM